MSGKNRGGPPPAATPAGAGIVFGPVPSRRLGRSLGVDLVPAKTCNLDCVYCEAGRTTRLTTARAELVPVAAVLAELEAALSVRPALDYVTFSGAGEPTLHSGIGRIIRWLKERHPAYRVCLLTNGILLADPAVRQELAPLDLIVPSLDAADEATFRRINRPAPGLSCRQLPEAFAAFRRESRAAFWLEVFVIPGGNDHPEAIAALREAVALIRPDKVQLNWLDRPGPESWVAPATAAALAAFTAALAPLAPVETVGRGRSGAAPDNDLPAAPAEVRIRAMLRRRPCTMADLVAGLALPPPTVQAAVAKLLADGTVAGEPGERGEFYVLSPGAR